MSLDTLLEAANYLEKATKGTSKDDTALPRANTSGTFLAERRRAVSESDHERRSRRPGGAGTRETHNKLEKNRRAHLKECFDFLKKQVPNLEEKKTSNLNILRGALKYIQTLKKSEVDQHAAKDLLTVSNSVMKKRIEALTKDIQSQTSGALGSDPDKALVPSSAASKVQNSDSRMLPVSVATQTSFNAAEGNGVASTGLEKSNASESSKDTEARDDIKENEVEAERNIKCEEDDESEEIDVENDDTENGKETESRENLKKGEVQVKIEPASGDEEMNGEERNGMSKNEEDKEKITMPNGVRNFQVSKESNRKRPHPKDEADDEREEERNAKIKGCARVSC